ncbi:MAG: hypothetical protein ABFC38_07460 [Methanospirillum sp.]
MATEKRQTIVSLDTSLLERAMAYGTENGIPIEALIEQGLGLRLDGAPVPAVESSLPAPLPELEALADSRIREQLPQIVREWLESARGAEFLKRLVIPYVPEVAPHEPETVPHAPEAAEGVDVPLSVLARLQRQRMIRLEEATGVDIPTLHAIRTGKQSRLPKETLEKLVAGLEQVEADKEADYELEGMHG